MYEAIKLQDGWAVRSNGCLLSENGHSFLSGNGFGEPKIWRGADAMAKAKAVAEWLSCDYRGNLSNRQRRDLRVDIVTRHGLASETARGLLQ